MHGGSDAVGEVHARVEKEATVDHIKDIDARRDKEGALGPVGFVHDFVSQSIAGADCQDHDEGQGEDRGGVEGGSRVCSDGGCGGGRAWEGTVLLNREEMGKTGW